MIRYKDLFYNDVFNQETAKKFAQVDLIKLIILIQKKNILSNIYLIKDIFTRYISVAATDSIDCPKTERMKVHMLFSSNGVDKIPTARMRPTYEDTFDSIEEFLLNSLFGEWKAFMDAEENYFNHV